MSPERPLCLAVPSLALAAAGALALAAAGCGAAPSAPAPAAGAASSAATPRPLVTMPLELLGGLIPFVEVRVAGSAPLAFELDTGADGELLNARHAAELGLRVEDARIVGDAGGPIEMGVVRGVSYSLGDHQVAGATMHTVPLGFLEKFVAHRLDGLLGHGFLQAHIVELDYARRALSLYAPTTAIPVAAGQVEIPLEIGETEAFVLVQIGRDGAPPAEAKLELDTGSFDGLGLGGGFVGRTALVPAERPRISMLGTSIGGETTGYRTRVPWIQLGSYRIPSPVIAVVTSEDEDPESPVAGTLGAPILRQFRVILDYPHRRMILEPSAAFGQPLETDMLGLMIAASGKDFTEIRIHDIAPGSPAEEAGLRVGDLLTSLDGAPFIAASLERLWKLRGEGGPAVKLGVARGSEALVLTLRPRRRI